MDNLRSRNIDQHREVPERIEGLIDLNLLPSRYLPQRPSFLTIAAWLLAIALLGLLLPSTTRFREATAALSLERNRLQIAQDRLLEESVEPEELEAVRTDIEAAQSRATELRSALDQVDIQVVRWGHRLQDAVDAAPDGIRIETIQEDEGRVTILGLADRYGEPLAYVDALTELDAYDSVVLQAINRVEFEPGVDPFLGFEGLLEEEDGEEPPPTPTPAPDDETVVAYAFRLQAHLAGLSLSEGAATEEVMP